MADQDFQWFTMLDVEELGIDKIAKEAADRANDNVDAVYIELGYRHIRFLHLLLVQENLNQMD